MDFHETSFGAVRVASRKKSREDTRSIEKRVKAIKKTFQVKFFPKFIMVV